MRGTGSSRAGVGLVCVVFGACGEAARVNEPVAVVPVPVPVQVPVSEAVPIFEEEPAPVVAAVPVGVAPVPLEAVAVPVVVEGEAGELERARVALGDGDAEAVEMVEQQAVGRESLVLYRWYGARAWRARERGAGRLEASLAELERHAATCEAAEGIESVCLIGAVADPYVAWSLAGAEVFAWEVARLRGATVLARARLFAVTRRVEDSPHKFKVYDIDGDGRSELTVIVPVDVPTHYEAMDTERGELGFILEAADLHVQFSATRRHSLVAQDVGGSESEAETVWQARDGDKDGHPELHVRETSRVHDLPGEDDPPAAPDRRTSRTTVCAYDLSADLWRCPEALGQQLLAPR